MNSSRFVAVGQAVRSRAEIQERHYKCLCTLIGILAKATQIEETLNKILWTLHHDGGLQYGVVDFYDPENSLLQVGGVYWD